MTQTAIKMALQFPTSPNVCFCIIWKKQNRQNVHKNQQKNLIKFHLSVYVATNSQSITRFDCCAAARLLNRPHIQEYWWIQKATGEVCIGLEQNVKDDAINK